MAITASNYWPLGSTVPKTFTDLNVGTDIKHFGFITVNPVNGCMVMFYRKASTYVGTIGTIWMRRSNDGGAHWENDYQIKTETNVDLRNLSGGYTSSGRLHLFYGRYYNNTSWYPIGFIHSDSDGTAGSWSDSQTLNTQPGTSAFSPYGHIVEVAGTYYQTWYEVTGGVYYLRISKSTDYGVSYPIANTITVYSGSTPITEPSMVHVGGGGLLIIARMNGGGSFAQFRSVNGGFNWIGPETTAFEQWSNGQNNAWLSYINYQGVGIVACYYVRRDSGGNKINVVYGLASNLINGANGWVNDTVRNIIPNINTTQSGCVSFWHPQNQIAGIGMYFYASTYIYPVVIFTPTNNIINDVLTALMP